MGLGRSEARGPIVRSESGPGSLSGGEPVEARGSDARYLGFVEQADAAADHAEDAAREERPRFGVGVPVRMEDAFRLALADQAGDEVVHLAHVATEMATELRVLGGLAERLDPQLGHLELAIVSRDVSPPHRLERLADVCRRPEGLLPRRTTPAPHVVERGEIEVALRSEVAVEDRLRAPGGPRDL